MLKYQLIKGVMLCRKIINSAESTAENYKNAQRILQRSIDVLLYMLIYQIINGNMLCRKMINSAENTAEISKNAQRIVQRLINKCKTCVKICVKFICILIVKKKLMLEMSYIYLEGNKTF